MPTRLEAKENPQVRGDLVGDRSFDWEYFVNRWKVTVPTWVQSRPGLFRALSPLVNQINQFISEISRFVGDQLLQKRGYVSGPPLSTDNGVARWDGTSGRFLQDSLTKLTDLGSLRLGDSSNPSARLDVGAGGGTEVRAARIESNGTTSTNFLLVNAASGGQAWVFRSHATSGKFDIQETEGGSVRLTIDTSGNVGISNSSPSEVLDVTGNIKLSGKAIVGACEIHSGTGTPEGAVAAPVGSLFLRDDGGAGTSLYVKESGAGNTGWVGK